jgi:hypothetical protein
MKQCSIISTLERFTASDKIWTFYFSQRFLAVRVDRRSSFLVWVRVNI